MARAWIGTSGFNYDDWEGVLYPEDLAEDEWFEHYSRRFDAVELNVTFYRLPDRETFEGWAGRSPSGFGFVLKGSRYITHQKKFNEPEDAIDRFFGAAEPLGSRLKCVLWQAHPNLKADAEKLDSFLDAVEDVSTPPGTRHAFEFRDESWFEDDAVADTLEEHDAAFVLADMPFQVLAPGQRSRSIDRPEVRADHTSDFAYVRRHGPEERYASKYPDSMRASDATWVQRWIDEGKDVFVFYNNDSDGFAVRDADSLRRRLGQGEG